jgi:purine nucleosidase
MRVLARLIRWTVLSALAAVGLFLLTLAIPLPAWRTGRMPLPPMELVEGGPPVEIASRVWVDTDAACGAGARTDPDDCFALALLAHEPRLQIAGISTVFGNAPLEATDRTARSLTGLLGDADGRALPVHAGASAPSAGADSPAVRALQQALADGPLTIVALGPLTNIAAALEHRPDLRRTVVRLIAVMGRRPGHIFHPAEGHRSPMLFGHGPVFRDLNFTEDPEAAKRVLAMRLPLTLIPYDAARGMILSGADLDSLGRSGPALRWIVAQAQGWLEFWRSQIGTDGFAPFDMLAAAYALEPRLFNCAPTHASVGPDRLLWHDWFYRPDALLVGSGAPPGVGADVVYCPQVASELQAWLIAQMATAPRP